MSRITDHKCKLCRREGMKLFLKGQRCFTEKCAVSRRDYPPGVHAQKRAKVTEARRQAGLAATPTDEERAEVEAIESAAREADAEDAAEEHEEAGESAEA